MARSEAIKGSEERRARGTRLGFRVDQDTKSLIERAARLERRNLTDFCLTALAEAARRTIAHHQTMLLSERDREVFFDALVNPPEPDPRLRRAFKTERERISRESHRLATVGATDLSYT